MPQILGFTVVASIISLAGVAYFGRRILRSGSMADLHRNPDIGNVLGISIVIQMLAAIWIDYFRALNDGLPAPLIVLLGGIALVPSLVTLVIGYVGQALQRLKQ